ncbi:MAG: SUMF1/EgtB/PvdO family nonheme iron enzyme [Anaerolineales bacterium]|nr:SUMF1/EgtB/PvdO family nonheme iron enzyme [Anaerolineales bacterium]
MTQIFISYSRRDLAFVEQLAADLKATGLDVWYDLSGLEGGSRWSRELEKAIRESQYVLVVLSPDSVSSKWVEEEFLFASELNKKIVPLFYRQCSLPFGYRTLHFIDVQGSKYKQNFDEVLRALGVWSVEHKESLAEIASTGTKPEEGQKRAARPKPQEKTPEPERIPKQQQWKPRNLIILIALIGLGCVAIFGLPQLLSQPESALEPTPTITKEVAQEISTPVTLTVTAEPSLTPTKVTTPTVTPFPAEITDEFGVEMVPVPAGEFTMGSDDIYGAKPAHMIFLDAYYIDKYEVTNALYKICVDAKVCDLPRRTSSSSHYSYYDNPEFNNYPVMYINWFKAKAYCEWRGARLPTEAEWEKAARGTDARTYPWGEGIDCKKANYAGCVGDAVEVGRYESGKSPYGIYDMVGNVSEWVADWYSETYYQNSPVSNPFGPEIGEHRVRRGGDYSVSNNNVSSAHRFYFDPAYTSVGLGFRCAKDATP